MGYANIEDKKIKHLELIQSIISRLNANSFVIKGWVITIVSAVLALFASTSNTSFVVITALPIFVFWIVDTFYLQSERKFVDLYKLTVADQNGAHPFSLNIDVDGIKDAKRNRYFSVFFSRTIFGFYFSLLLIAGASAFFIVKKEEASKTLDVKVSSADTLHVQMQNR